MDNTQSPPMIEKTNEIKKMLEKPNTEIAAAAMTGAIACVSVLPRL